MKHVAVVTGASSGLGRHYALQLAEDRSIDEVWIVARRADRLEELAAEIGTKIGVGRAKPVVLDLAKPDSAELLAESLDREECRIGVFVNNAGYGSYGPFAGADPAFQLGMIDLNVRALTALSYLAAARMDPGSVIINVASLAAFMPLGNFAVYAATKAYVLSFSSAIRAEFRDRGIKVCAVCPGPVATEFSRVASRGARQEVKGGRDASRVAAASLRHARAGRPRSLFLLKWKLGALLSRFVSRDFIASFSFKHMKRPTATGAPKAGT